MESPIGWTSVMRDVVKKTASLQWLSDGKFNITIGENAEVEIKDSSIPDGTDSSPQRSYRKSQFSDHQVSESSVQEVFKASYISSISLSEVDRLSLKKQISDAEIEVAHNVQEEFKELKKRWDLHDGLFAESIASDELRLIERRRDRLANHLHFLAPSDLPPAIDLASIMHSYSEQNVDNSKARIEESAKKEQIKKLQELQDKQRAKQLIKDISDLQKEYNQLYEEVLSMLQSHETILSAELSEGIDELKKRNEIIISTIVKFKTQRVEETDLEKCRLCVNFIKNFVDKLSKRIEKVDEEVFESIPVKEEIEIIEPEEEAPSNQTIDRKLQRKQFIDYVTNFLIDTENSLHDFINDPKHKIFRRDCQKAVNVAVNAISPTSSSHLADKLMRLTKLLDGGYVSVSDRQFTASSHPLGIKYSTMLLARKIVKVGEDVVSSHPETAYAVASVTSSLVLRYPRFTILLFAYFYRVCPYLVPHYPEKLPGESTKDHDIRLGFLYVGDERENIDKFLKRMSGVCQMFGAILITPRCSAYRKKPYPLGVAESWQWITHFISLEPKSDISATLMLDVLEVTGNKMLERYGFMFQKLLHLICTDYIEKIEKVTMEGRGGPVQRLKRFLQDVIKVQRISPPKGLLPEHFW